MGVVKNKQLENDPLMVAFQTAKECKNDAYRAVLNILYLGDLPREMRIEILDEISSCIIGSIDALEAINNG